jgi:D-alanyl-D-alanine dipeptidase
MTRMARKTLLLVAVVIPVIVVATAADVRAVDASELDLTKSGLADVAATVPVKVDLKYGTADNFMKRDVYSPLGLKRCFLVPDAAKMLADAHALLVKHDPDLTFVMYDCARPRSVQLVMWDVVKGTPQQGYVADPTRPPGSVHNTGCAVDLSVWNNKTGAPLDMGTPYDFFGAAAQPRKEADLYKEKKLTNEQLANRVMLREVMLRAGFRILPHEWWHFDCKEPSAARKAHAVIP